MSGRRVWRDLDSAAARWAAPWWALTWLLTLGRQGRLPWTWEEWEEETFPTWRSPWDGGHRGPELVLPPTVAQIPATPPRRPDVPDTGRETR